MCDTLCAFSPYAEQGTVLFAKNSDRSPNEPHLVIHVPEKEHIAGSPLKLTYITIPQVKYTYAAVLCKPSWIWGAEMGVNSASVEIGNEAVFTKVKRGPEALIGMDLVRLALERCETAEKAVELITSLLEKYGQGGNCGFDHEFFYDNSFLIVDPKEGYVIETAGKRWAVVKVSGKHAISNRLSIRKEHIYRGGERIRSCLRGGFQGWIFTGAYKPRRQGTHGNKGIKDRVRNGRGIAGRNITGVFNNS